MTVCSSQNVHCCLKCLMPYCQNRIWQHFFFFFFFLLVILRLFCQETAFNSQAVILQQFSITTWLHPIHQVVGDFVGTFLNSFARDDVEDVFSQQSWFCLSLISVFSQKQSTFWKVSPELWVVYLAMVLQIEPFILWNDIITKQMHTFSCIVWPLEKLCIPFKMTSILPRICVLPGLVIFALCCFFQRSCHF